MHGKQRLCNYYEKVNVRYSEIKRGNIMTAITAAKARENIYQLIQDVNTNAHQSP